MIPLPDDTFDRECELLDELIDMCARIMNDPRYEEGLAYGVPRKGHPEGTVRAHLEELNINLWKLAFADIITGEEYWKIKVIILVHDIMKVSARRDAAISDPDSHASLAAKFLAEFTDDQDLINIVQAHDENLALWLQYKAKTIYKEERLKERVIDKIKDLDLLLMFQICDGYTAGKTDMREMLRWFVDEVNKYKSTPRVYKALELFGL